MESSNSDINDSVNNPIQIQQDENGTNPNSSSPPQQHSNDEINNGDDDHLQISSDALAKGLSSMLASVIKDFDSKAQDTLNSQDQLALALDRLTRELDKLLEDAPLPFIMQHASKISGVRKRVSSLNSVLRSIQRRVDNIDRTLSVGVRHGICTKLCTAYPDLTVYNIISVGIFY